MKPFVKIFLFIVLSVVFCNSIFTQNTPDTLPQKDTSNIVVPNTVTPSPRSVAANGNDTLFPRKRVGFVSDKLEAYFLNEKVMIDEGEPVSNVMVVKNKNKDPLIFFFASSAPSSWKAMNSGRLYTLNENDSVFIPVYLLSSKLLSSSNYLITTFLFTKDSVQIGNLYFIAVQKKTSRWKISTFPERTDYIAFGKDTSHFLLNIHNTGNLDQTLKMSVQKRDKVDDIKFYYPDGKPLNTGALYPLPPGADTTLALYAQFNGNKRNYRRINVETYTPRSFEQTQRDYPVFFYAMPVSLIDKKSAARSKLTFRKLPNILRLNPYSFYGIPFTMQTDVYGMFSPFIIMNTFLHGETYLKEDEYFSYRFMIPLVLGSRTQLGKIVPYIGYFRPEGSIEIGNISAGIYGASGGQGIKTRYNIPSKGIIRNSVGAFYMQSPYLFNRSDLISYGVYHDLYFTKQGHVRNIRTALTRKENLFQKANYNYLSAQSAVNFLKYHSISLHAVGNINEYRFNPTTVTHFGVMGTLGYSGTYLKNTLRFSSSLTGGTQYSIASGEMYRINIRTSYRIKNWTPTASFTQNEHSPIYYSNGTFYSINRIYSRAINVGISNRKLLGGFHPSYIHAHNISRNIEIIGNGGTLNYNYFNRQDNFRFSIMLNAMNNRVITIPNKPYYISYHVMSAFNYRTLSGNLHYYYNDLFRLYVNNNMGHVASSVTPQTMRLTLNYDYLFKNEKVLLNTSFNYYRRQSSSSVLNSFTIVPKFYFFTYGGWRFNFFIEYYHNIAQFGDVQNPTATESAVTSTSNRFLTFNAGAKKDFVIPLLKKKKQSFMVDFVTFLDVNGNGKRDKNEDLLKNVVIKINEYEIITNEMGRATIMHLPKGKYKISPISLENLEGWFPMQRDSQFITTDEEITIPFIRGIRVYGNISLQREKYSPGSDQPIDLSRIRITVFDSVGKAQTTLTGPDGNFQFYLPIGKYIVTLNEDVLSERYKLSQNNLEIDLNKDLDNLYVSFFLVERQRKLNVKKFGENGSTNSSGGSGNRSEIKWTVSDTVVTNTPPPGSKKVFGHENFYYYMLPTGQGITYRMQIYSSSVRLTPAEIESRFKGVPDVKEYFEEGIYKYTAGEVNAVELIKPLKEQLRNLGYKDAFVVPFKDGKRIEYKK